MKPNQAVILGIDSGAVSGWSIFFSDRFYCSGTAENVKEMMNAIKAASASVPFDGSSPLIVGREEWTPGWSPQKRSFSSIIGTGVGWGRWESLIELWTGLPKNRVFAVDPGKWRSAILSLKRGRHSREQAKRAAIAYCEAKGWKDARQAAIDHNQAEATLIAYFMAFDKRVADRLRILERRKE